MYVILLYEDRHIEYELEVVGDGPEAIEKEEEEEIYLNSCCRWLIVLY